MGGFQEPLATEAEEALGSREGGFCEPGVSRLDHQPLQGPYIVSKSA